MSERENFYRHTVNSLIEDKNASILVCGGGPLDKTTLEGLGFRNVTISNLDTRMTGNEYAPFKWKHENAEALSFGDASFDYVITHAAMHHASSPHRVLTEMYRVSKIGTLAFESRDSFVMKLLERFGFTLTYEHGAVYYSDCQYGGVNNTAIPNYIYRWTEREIEKTIRSYAPCFSHEFSYRYGTAFPSAPEYENKGKLKTVLLMLMRPLFWGFVKVFPRQQNLFAFFVEKPSPDVSLFPWLTFDTEEQKITFNRQWGEARYKSPALFPWFRPTVHSHSNTSQDGH